ncbi:MULTISPECIES: response regulator [unclassified Bradyrhizobium]|uniref:response regulator n=1 Tax=unclassified Bradyrhizobium TaxID=2631580 RepID=UPI002478467A|nr:MULTISPECIES: response regulator [unclassified Bradyrhizobium]WGR71699.1 response regulator [Bradyrhizobium sp. ISRA426]WGR76534.1 response regulator [Bradyrhizobium sp. ISRA430]WGR86939.1 response regulator [Bradyrhizobium sp. ISRA432]
MEQAPRHGQRGTVLLAEHDVLVRMPIAQYLRDCGYKVLEAVTTEEAIEALEDRRFDVGAVISSIQLAGDGFGIATWVKQHSPHTTMLLTGTPKRAVDAAAELCSDDALPTRLAPQLLLQRILQMLATRRPPAQEGRTAML